MEKTNMPKLLTAVLFADVVDYSLKMGEDEQLTLAALELLRNKIFEPSVSEFNGQVVKDQGDGWLVEYKSASEAVESGIQIQRVLSNFGFLSLRIGIHAGDITRSNDDVYGDAVNVASRLQSSAKSGQVLISDTIYNSLDRKTGKQFKGGEQIELKNIYRPVTVWHWSIATALQNTSLEQKQNSDASGISNRKEAYDRVNVLKRIHQENITSYFWRVADAVVFRAGLSAFIWCSVWLLGFFVVTMLLTEMNIPTTTTAFILTMTVLLGHLPKFFALLFGTDADFRDISEKFETFSVREAPWVKLLILLVLMSYLIFSLTVAQSLLNLSSPLDPTHLNSFALQTTLNSKFCLILFAIQFIFSFPSEIQKP